jgi:signal transduction histidine kinase/DNA-binding NarL/FixJ family response regulator/HPt (histidine-containing phosphotransfer) domain-containing protein
MAVMIISLVVVLIMTSMAIFAYRDEVYTLETRKDNLLSLSVKYYNFLGNIQSNAKQYLQTNDEKYKSEFYNQINNYIDNDSITMEFRVFSGEQAPGGLKDLLLGKDFTISSQAGYIRFNETEQRLYRDYLSSINRLIDIFSAVVDSRDNQGIMTVDFDSAYSSQSSLMAELSRSYISRLNQLEDTALQRQKFLEYALVAVSLLLLCFAAATFCLILRENAYNAYFSKLYNTVVENIDGGIAILDKNYRFDYMNPKYREILGIPAGDPKGKTLHDTFEQSLADILENATLDNPSGEGKLDLIIGNKRKNILYSYFTIEDDRGSNKYVHLLRDTTKTEELQAQLRRQLQEINFYSQAKDSFIANISHEIKTPINAILGMVHFLKRTRLSQNQKDLVRKIETSSDILLTIISDVLDLSKIKSNTLSLYPSDFSLETAIRNIEDMFSSQLAAKEIEWRTDYDFNRSLCLHLDKTRFVQVLVNLINNACKFTESGYIKLSVETLSESDETVLLQFCVEDTGIGIAEKDISKLFREFEQLENHLTKQHQGTGLGLYICKNIIESMDGRMWVKSTKGQGSQFYFSLPAKKSLEPLLAGSADVIKAAPLNGYGGKALVVEDTEINAEVAVRLLNEVNIACDTAADGTSAIELCRNKPSDYYNVILMDIHMPNMDGYTAAGILKKEMSVVSPIIALTASDINEQIRAEHADTIETFILKPFKAEAFYNAISPCFSDRCCKAASADAAEAKPAVKAGAVEKSTVIERPTFPGPSITVKASSVEKAGRDPFAGREDAIKNLGGLESIYNKHIEKFKMNYANTAESISTLLREKKYDEARRLAHSVKGLGGTLGMLYVMESSSALEKAILKGENYDLSAELENFDRELKAAIEVI